MIQITIIKDKYIFFLFVLDGEKSNGDVKHDGFNWS